MREEGTLDRWGRDPGVQDLRRAFAEMDQRQRELLARNRVPEFEPRLAVARRQACRFLERGWTLAARQGFALTAQDLGVLYENVLAGILARQGLMAPPEEPPGPWGPLIRRLFDGES
jgi:hypothetical protein